MGCISCGWEKMVLKWGGRSQFDIRQGRAFAEMRGGAVACMWGGEAVASLWGVGWGVLDKMLGGGAVTEIEDGRYKVERGFFIQQI